MKRFSLFSLLLITLLATVGCGMISTGDDAANRAGDIADFTVPPGFTPGFSMNVADMVMIGYKHSDGRSHIFIMQAPESADITAEEMEQQLRQALSTAQGQDSPTITDGKEVALTIRGQDVTGVVGNGVSSSDDTSFRILTAPFTGKGGPAILIYQRPEADWSQTEADDFIASFK